MNPYIHQIEDLSAPTAQRSYRIMTVRVCPNYCMLACTSIKLVVRPRLQRTYHMTNVNFVHPVGLTVMSWVSSVPTRRVTTRCTCPLAAATDTVNWYRVVYSVEAATPLSSLLPCGLRARPWQLLVRPSSWLCEVVSLTWSCSGAGEKERELLSSLMLGLLLNLKVQFDRVDLTRLLIGRNKHIDWLIDNH